MLSEKEVASFFSNTVIIEEKIDGANLGISFNKEGRILLQNRGDYLYEPYSGQWAAISKWLDNKIESLFDYLFDRYIIFGEWCYLKHSVYYNALPDWFVAFDIFDKQNKTFLTVSERNKLAKAMRLATVPFISSSQSLSLENLDTYVRKSAFGDETSEGLYLRIEANDQLLRRAKYVRPSFSQAINKHWSSQSLQKNKIAQEYSV